VQSRAEALADRLMCEREDGSRIRRAFLLCFGRAPAADELEMAASFFARGGSLTGDDEKPPRQLLAAFCQALLSTAEFRNLD
jgi:hypothetical protein